VVILLLIGLLVFLLAYGPPLLALWLVGRAVAATARHQEWRAGDYGILLVELLALWAAWYLVRRHLPPFRWRY
jgi:hypothetical protein